MPNSLSYHYIESMLQKATILQIIMGYVIAMLAIQSALNLSWPEELWNTTNLIQWDAHHYQYIAAHGYKDFRVAFFPLFPFVWRWSFLGPMGISILNAVLFLAAFYWLMRGIKATPLETLLYLSIPSFIFFYLPYTETLFFISSCLLLYGLRNERTSLVMTGLLLCTLVRPVFMILLPAVIITELVSKKPVGRMLKRVGGYVLATFAGVLLVAWIQYLDTGRWFEFIGIQKNWGNELQLPTFPLTSWAGGFIVRLDGLALLSALIAGIVLLVYLADRFAQRKMSMPGEVVCSLAYLGGMALLSFFVKGGSLASLNRYVFAVPFFIVALHYYLQWDRRFSHKHVLIFFLAVFVYWFLFRSFVHIATLLLFTAVTFYACLFVIMKSQRPKLAKYGTILVIAINVIFQGLFFVRYLTGEWVG